MTDQTAALDGAVTLSGATGKAYRFHYRAWGEPSLPLLLLHGFSEQGRSYDTLAADLSDRYYVLALDQRGHGESDWTDSYRWQAFVDDVGAFIAALGIGPVTLVGHSMGGTSPSGRLGS
jgi:pimeloyl-ACP methyl ester carboxylesterase